MQILVQKLLSLLTYDANTVRGVLYMCGILTDKTDKYLKSLLVAANRGLNHIKGGLNHKIHDARKLVFGVFKQV